MPELTELRLLPPGWCCVVFFHVSSLLVFATVPSEKSTNHCSLLGGELLPEGLRLLAISVDVDEVLDDSRAEDGEQAFRSEARYLPVKNLVSFGDEFCHEGLVVVGVARVAKEILRFLVVRKSAGGEGDVGPVVFTGGSGCDGRTRLVSSR